MSISKIEYVMIEDKYIGISFPKPFNWKLSKSNDKLTWCSISPNKDSFIFFSFKQKPEESENILEQIIELALNKKPYRIVKVKSENNAEIFNIEVEDEKYYTIIFIIEETNTMTPLEFSPNLYEAYHDSYVDANILNKDAAKFYFKSISPINIKWLTFRGVGMIETKFRDMPELFSELVNVIFKAKKTFSLIGFDVPMKRVLNLNFHKMGLRWSIDIPLTWDAHVGIDDVIIEAKHPHSKSGDITIFIKPVEITDDFKSYISSKYNESRDKYNIEDISFDDDHGNLKLTYMSNGRKMVKQFLWTYFTRTDAYNNERKFVLEVAVYYPLEIEDMLRKILHKVFSSWCVYESWLHEELRFPEKRFEKELERIESSEQLDRGEVFHALQRQNEYYETIMHEFKKESEYREKFWRDTKKKFNEINDVRKCSMERQKSLHEQYMEFTKRILRNIHKLPEALKIKSYITSPRNLFTTSFMRQRKGTVATQMKKKRLIRHRVPSEIKEKGYGREAIIKGMKPKRLFKERGRKSEELHGKIYTLNRLLKGKIKSIYISLINREDRNKDNL